MIKQSDQQFVIEKTIRIDAPREHVFGVLTKREELARWLSVKEFQPRLGGRFQMFEGDGAAVGEIVEFEPPRVVAWTWDWQDQPFGVRTIVRFQLEAEGNATVVRLTHTGIADAERREMHAHGWEYYIGRLKSVAEGRDPGPDKNAQ